jgi:hypothetical protein
MLVGNYKGKRPLGRPRHRWKNTFKMDVKEIMCEVVDWNHVAHSR